MGLDICSKKKKKNFHIGYFGFSKLRSYFILHYGEDLFEDYNKILRATMKWDEKADVIFDELLEEIGDLSILINHSDCDGELTSDECKRLSKCLFVDEYKIKSVLGKLDGYNREYIDTRIKFMYEFIDLVDYCAMHDGVKLIFG